MQHLETSVAPTARRGIPERPRSHRRLPAGAEFLPGRGVEFRVWAPSWEEAEVVIADLQETEERTVSLASEGAGWFCGIDPLASPGALYGFRRPGSDRRVPDPMSRFQPEGPHGPSQVVDPDAFEWTDHDWKGPPLEGQVVYELHVGTFTQEGTWSGAIEQLPHLVDLGVTLLELMPVGDFPGRFGWGYDGVNLFAPCRLYGTPDEFRRFVDAAHAAGIGVLLDVVYNHLGPDGNYLGEFSPHYFSTRHKTDWGAAINFDGDNSGPVREYFVANAAYWIDEFHLDGLRIDATQDIHDESPRHILADLAAAVRGAAGGRRTIVIAENEPQHTRLLRPASEGGYGIDAAWNDDFHHTAMVALTGRKEAYYTDYLGSPQEFISSAKYGYLYQGQHYVWQKKRRGTPTRGLTPKQFVNFIQNHDQIANSGRGLRAHDYSSPGTYRALTAVLLLFPGTPMLFQGQEFAASSPFFYFADHHEELARMVHEGRKAFMRQFRSVGESELFERLPDPADPMTFARSKLNFAERHAHAEAYALHRDLLRLRRSDPVIRLQGELGLDGAVLADHCFVLRYFAPVDCDRLLIVNLGIDRDLHPSPEPLLAPCTERGWRILWSSEDLRYGGSGTAPLETEDGWKIPGRSAVLLGPADSHEPTNHQPPPPSESA